jgi:c-di-GMP-binding flagellar brake protein YcgR
MSSPSAPPAGSVQTEMSSASNRQPGTERRRHFRIDGEWAIRVDAVEDTGAVTEFEGTAFNISMSGLMLEAAVNANLWVNKELTLDLPGGVGPVRAIVRRFLEYGDDGHKRTRWGVEFAGLSMEQRAHWARFIFSEAHRLGQEEAHRAFLANEQT